MDQAEAYAWYHLAAGTLEAAAGNRDKLKQSLSPQQLEDAQKRVKELQASIKAGPLHDM